MKPNQQDKCECKHKLHDIEGEPCPLWDVRAYLRNGKKVMLCGDCKTDTDVLIAPSIQREKCKEFWEKTPYTSEHLWKADHHGLASGNCTKCGMPIAEWRRKLENMLNLNTPKVAPSPRQEAWADRFDARFRFREGLLEGVYKITKDDVADIKAFLRQELTTLHKADCERFRDILSMDNPYPEEVFPGENGRLLRTAFEACRLTAQNALSKLEEDYGR